MERLESRRACVNRSMRLSFDRRARPWHLRRDADACRQQRRGRRQASAGLTGGCVAFKAGPRPHDCRCRTWDGMTCAPAVRSAPVRWPRVDADSTSCIRSSSSASRPESVVAVTNYGADFACVVRRGNIYGVQFHPEKSHHFGTRLLQEFRGALTCCALASRPVC